MSRVKIWILEDITGGGLGWLTGLEPATTGITIQLGRMKPIITSNIKHLKTVKMLVIRRYCWFTWTLHGHFPLILSALFLVLSSIFNRFLAIYWHQQLLAINWFSMMPMQPAGYGLTPV